MLPMGYSRPDRPQRSGQYVAKRIQDRVVTSVSPLYLLLSGPRAVCTPLVVDVNALRYCPVKSLEDTNTGCIELHRSDYVDVDGLFVISELARRGDAVL